MANKKVFLISIDADHIKDLKNLAVETDKTWGDLLEEAIKGLVNPELLNLGINGAFGENFRFLQSPIIFF